jgi:hypothetical protein
MAPSHPSKAQLVQRTVIDVADSPGSTSIIGCDAANDSCTQPYGDERGACRPDEMRVKLLPSQTGSSLNLTWRS